MSATVAPRISELYFAEREDELQRLVLTSVRWIFAPTLALVILMAAASGPILGVFGKDFVEGRWVLAIIAVGQLVSVSSGPVGWLMNLTGREKLTAKVFAITAVITLGLYLVLIKPFGIVGAAIANSAGIAMFNIVLTLQARRSLGYDVSIVAALKLERRQRS
jgi:O-antigen/teichoic acid export membrane protein